mmetsp:Transcript_29867/g.92176  ORF Transcript_29867/g.92176 Transcript_29867/m.92176 type:complete len:208 (-) Transcript_29867:13-636(-)
MPRADVHVAVRRVQQVLALVAEELAAAGEGAELLGLHLAARAHHPFPVAHEAGVHARHPRLAGARPRPLLPRPQRRLRPELRGFLWAFPQQQRLGAVDKLERLRVRDARWPGPGAGRFEGHWLAARHMFHPAVGSVGRLASRSAGVQMWMRLRRHHNHLDAATRPKKHERGRQQHTQKLSTLRASARRGVHHLSAPSSSHVALVACQ